MTNGNGKVTIIILGIFASIMIALFTISFNQSKANAEQISRNNRSIGIVETDIRYMKNAIDRIEDKQDVILQELRE